MSYLEYVVAAYVVFAVVLAWDFVAGHMQVRRELQRARRRGAREVAASVPPSLDELTR